MVSTTLILLALAATPDGADAPPVVEAAPAVELPSVVEAPKEAPAPKPEAPKAAPKPTPKAEPPPAAAPQSEPPVVEEELGFFDVHFPFGAGELEPEVEDDFWFMYIVSVFLGVYGGPIWIPRVITDVDPGPEYQSAALWKWLWDMGLLVGGILAIYPCVLCGGVGACVPLAFVVSYSYYFAPVGTMVLFDHHVKKAKRAGTLKRKKPEPEDASRSSTWSPHLAMAY